GQEIEAVSAEGRRVFGDYSDVTVALLSLTDGTLACVENHWLLHPSSARSCLAGVQVFGDAGSALVDLSTDELELITAAEPRSVRVDTRNWTHDPQVSGGALRRERSEERRVGKEGGCGSAAGQGERRRG